MNRFIIKSKTNRIRLVGSANISGIPGPKGDTGPQGPPGSGGAGDITSVNSSLDNALVIYDGATGKALKPATGTGVVKVTNGVLGFALPEELAVPTVGTDLLKGDGDGGTTSAIPGTDYLRPSGNGSSLTGITTTQIGGLQTALDLKANQSDLNTHTTNTSNPHNVTKTQIGLGNVDNTSDVNKPISTATQTALTSEANRATAAEAAVQSGLDTEVARATAAENTKANDSSVVHLSGTETVTGRKTFSAGITLPDPTSPGDGANKAYVDATAQGLSIKSSVELATAAALPTNTYSSGAETLTATSNGALSVDGVAVSNGDSVLAKNETTQANNGIYEVTAVGSVSTPYVLTRSSEMDANSEVAGAFVFVTGGSSNANSGFVVNGTGPYTVGTTPILWTQFSGAGQITVTAGLTKTGNTLGIDTAVVETLSGNQTVTGTKTFSTAPNISAIANGGTLTLPTSTDTLVGRNTTDTLTNKTLTTPTIGSLVNVQHDHSNAANGGPIIDASSTQKGAMALAGDLSNTPAAPYVKNRDFNCVISKDEATGVMTAILNDGTRYTHSTDFLALFNTVLPLLPEPCIIQILPSATPYLIGAATGTGSVTKDTVIFGYGAKLLSNTAHTGGEVFKVNVNQKSLMVFGLEMDLNRQWGNGIGGGTGSGTYASKLVFVKDVTIKNYYSYGVSVNDLVQAAPSTLYIDNLYCDAGGVNAQNECIETNSVTNITIKNVKLYSNKPVYVSGRRIYVDGAVVDTTGYTGTRDVHLQGALVEAKNLDLTESLLLIRPYGDTEVNKPYYGSKYIKVDGVVSNNVSVGAMRIDTYNDGTGTSQYVTPGTPDNDGSIDLLEIKNVNIARGAIELTGYQNSYSVLHGKIRSVSIENVKVVTLNADNTIVKVANNDIDTLRISNIICPTNMSSNSSGVVVRFENNLSSITIGDMAVSGVLPIPQNLFRVSDSSTGNTANVTVTRSPGSGLISHVVSGTPVVNKVVTRGADPQAKLYATVAPVNKGADYSTDGVADEVQIQAAIDAVSTAGGGIVHLKAGTYNLAARITPKNNVWIRGESKSSVIINAASGIDGFKNTKSGTTKTVYNNIRISSMTIVGNNREAIYIYNTDGVIIHNCNISIANESATRHGINLTYCRNIQIYENNVHDITGNGIAVNGCDYFSIDKNLIENVTDDNIDVDFDFRETGPAVYSQYGTVTNNICKGIGEPNAVGNGIRIEGSKYVEVIGNYCDQNDIGIQANSTTAFAVQYITIASNTVVNCTEWGIRAGAYDVTAPDEAGTRNNIVVTGNNVSQCGTTAFASRIRGGILVWSESTTVSDNIVDTCGNNESLGQQSAAILLYVKTNNAIVNNFISNSVTAIKAWNDSARTYANTKVYTNFFFNNTTNLSIAAVTTPGLAIVDGGTGASTASGARNNLGAQSKAVITVGPTGDSGYVTDGVADDVEIQAALVAANGGTVVLQKGTFSVNTRFRLPDNSTLIGQGMGVTTIKLVASAFGSFPAAGFMIQADNNSFGTVGINCTVANLSVDGSYDELVSPAVNKGGLIKPQSGWVIQNVEFKTSNYYKLFIDPGIHDVLVTHCSWTGLTGAGADCLGGTAGSTIIAPYNITVRDSHWYAGINGNPFDIVNGNNLKLIDNLFECSGSIYFEGGIGNEAVGNRIIGGGSLVFSSDFSYGSITDAHNCRHSLAERNFIYQSTGIGLTVVSHSKGTTVKGGYNRFIGNHIERSADIGMRIDCDPTTAIDNSSYGYDLVSGNVFKNNCQNNTDNYGTIGTPMSGLNILNGLGAVVTGNVAIDDQAVPTQRYGISFGHSGGTPSAINEPNNFVCTSNTVNGNKLGGIYIVSPTYSTNYEIGQNMGDA